MKTADFALAGKALRQANLITESREDQFIVLREGVGTDQVVRFLVEQNMAVYEIAHEEQTLEHFYLSLMNQQKK